MQPILDAISSKIVSGLTESFRVFHGRGECFPGLEQITVDFFQGILFITLFKPHPQEFVDELTKKITEMPNLKDISGIYLQRRYEHRAPGEVLYGEVPDTWKASEDGLDYRIRFGKSQNTGFFLDMKNGRRWIRENSQGKRVLNLFSYSCSFSVAAIAGGAESVVNLDMSTGALKIGRENHQLNDMDLSKVKFLQHDLFKSWGKLKRLGPFDLIVMDPPSMQKGSFVAEKDYAKVVRRIPQLLKKGGKVLAALNAPYLSSEFLPAIFAEEWPAGELLCRLDNPEEFIENDPDKGLKVYIFEDKEGIRLS